LPEGCYGAEANAEVCGIGRSEGEHVRCHVAVIVAQANGANITNCAPKGEPADERVYCRAKIEKYVQINRRRNGMKALVATIFAAGVSLTTLSSAQAITVTAAPLAEAAKETSSVVEVQANRAGGCERGYMMGPRGCQEVIWNYRKSSKKKKRRK
jgi:hypothetical protein